jgi:chromosome segregation ATPase
MKAACAWCQDLEAQKSDEAMTDMMAKAAIKFANLREQIAKAEVATNEARAEVERLRGELIATEAEEKAAVEAADLLTRTGRKLRAERDEALDALASLEQEIVRLLPYAYDDGTGDEADPEECLEYAANEMRQLRQDRDEARAEVARLRVDKP